MSLKGLLLFEQWPFFNVRERVRDQPCEGFKPSQGLRREDLSEVPNLHKVTYGQYGCRAVCEPPLFRPSAVVWRFRDAKRQSFRVDRLSFFKKTSQISSYWCSQTEPSMSKRTGTACRAPTKKHTLMDRVLCSDSIFNQIFP